MIGAGIAIPVLAVVTEVFPTATLVAILALPLAVAPLRAIWTATTGPPLIVALKATARLQLAVALLLAVGFMI
jgi:1,4-dihydroxy-2-naphthoate octaprenyltransferase